MIIEGGVEAYSKIEKREYDWLIYGLGFETRSPKIASYVSAKTKVLALQMPRLPIHSYDRNVNFAGSRKHIIERNFEAAISTVIPSIFERRHPLRVGFDVSSINRVMLVEILTVLARNCRAGDEIDVLYCPAAYSEPDWQFPQIERFGPINSTFSSVDSDPSKPLCLLLGAGFEAGTSLGIMSQLEPRVSYCFWGTGIDSRFDRAVRRANFDFDFGSINVNSSPYNLRDPKGAFQQIERVVFGSSREFRIIIVPMGPKLFTVLATLVAMMYVGRVAIWRVQHSRGGSHDAMPGKICIRSSVDCQMLAEFSATLQKSIGQDLTEFA